MRPMLNVAKIVISLFFILLFMPLTRQGMFVDGVWYAAIAKNMAAGLGSIWDPALSKTMFLHFREHPPLAIAMQSVFFYYLGDAFWVERLHCMLLAIFQIFLVYKLWLRNLLEKENVANRSLWWFLLLWILIPVNIGMYKNNLLEASLTLFSTLSCYCLIKSFKSTRTFIWHSFFTSVCLIMGFMCNGPTVLFPLAVPFLHGWLIETQPIKRLITRTLLLTGITSISFLFFFMLFPEALLNIKGYFKIQLMAAITGKRDLSFTGWNHFYIVYIYLKDYFLVLLASLAVIALYGQVSQQSFIKLLKTYTSDPWFQFYFLLSLCAALPVGISHRQMFHYISGSAPIFLLAMMHLTHEPFNQWMRHLQKQKETRLTSLVSKTLTALCVFVSVSVLLQVGGYNKNQQLIEDVKQVAAFLPKDQAVKGSPQIMKNFDVPPNFSRYSSVSFLDPSKKSSQQTSPYYVYYPNEPLPENYSQIALGLRVFKLAQISKPLL